MITPEEILKATELEVDDVVIDILTRAAERIKELEKTIENVEEDMWSRLYPNFGSMAR